MKKVTFLLLLFMVSIAFAQRVEPTFSWSNKSDYQINGESAVTFKPGDVITIEITYTLGSTNGIDDSFDFILAGLQDEAMADVDPLTGTWANETVAQPNDYIFPGAEASGVTSGTYTIPANAELNSENANLTYRILAYLAYTPDGGSTIFGGDGASDPTLVYIRSQAEIDALLSIDEFPKEQFKIYPNPVDDMLSFTDTISFDTFEIRDVTGKLIQSGGYTNTINVSSLEQGIYFVGINNTYKKFIKK